MMICLEYSVACKKTTFTLEETGTISLLTKIKAQAKVFSSNKTLSWTSPLTYTSERCIHLQVCYKM